MFRALFPLLALAFVPPQEADAADKKTVEAALDTSAGMGVLHPDEVLLCLDRKVASGDEIGLWMRHPEGRMERVWDGEPYDSLWRLDRTLLVVERWKGRVVELSSDFEEVRSVGGFDTPVDIEQNAAGHWLVVENRRGEVVCVDPESGRRLWRRGGFRQPFDAAPLPDGGLLVADSGANRVVQLDAAGTEVRVWGNLDFPNAVEPTPDGGFLVTNWTGGRVRRYDPEGQLAWMRKVGGTLQSAEERLDGRTTVCDGFGGRLLYLDPTGRLEHQEPYPRGAVDCETVVRP